ncbi:MAG: competence/damage-inducible protein A [Candidatus Omnitrophica bacterium]|nr:competence/damage-inducible protein A [Candidatus Omnitrophota bacterium]
MTGPACYNDSMRVELLTIGSELMSGAAVNTNAAYLARRLAELGLPCQRCVAVSDERESLLTALHEGLNRSDLLITTGGLGPTFDDLTMETIAEATGRSLRYCAAAAATIRRFYSRRHRTLQRAALRQALIPSGGDALPNPLGTAPGLWLKRPTGLLIALPGVPREMQAIMECSVLPRLRRLPGLDVIETRTLRTIGVVELKIQSCLERLPIPTHVQIGLYPSLRAVDIRLTATGASRRAATAALRRIETGLRRALGRAVYGADGDSLEGAVGQLLVRRRQTLAVAESCTGGLVSDRITNVPGSSRYLRGSVVAYHNDIKRGLLGVPAAMLARDGAVSVPVARAMAQGVRRMAGSDVGLAVTGIAGPTGATAKKPVGLIFLGLADRRGVASLRCQFFGDRVSVKMQAAQTALDFLRRRLLQP